MRLEELRSIKAHRGISKILELAYNDFCEKVVEPGSLCDYRNANFDETVDYHDEAIQLIYILRYGYAYAFEYKHMYQNVMDELRLSGKKNIEIDSIGCGSGIDLWSLIEAIEGKEKSFERIKWNGIDLVDWYYDISKTSLLSAPSCLRNEKVHMNAAGYYEQKETISADIIFFPRSITDIDSSYLHSIYNSFSNKHFEKNTLYLMFAGVRRKEIDGTEDKTDKGARQKRRINELRSAITRNGFVPLGEYTYKPENKGIYSLDKKMYLFPANVLEGNAISIIGEQSALCKWCYYERCVFKRNVMLTDNYVNYTIFKFERF